VLDYHDAVALIHKAVQHVEQEPHVLEVETRGRFIEDVQGPAGVPFGELGGQLDPLGLAARERRGCLAQVDVAQTHVVQ
jgi:hypothetical protein